MIKPFSITQIIKATFRWQAGVNRVKILI
jgi:hypothetical protein